MLHISSSSQSSIAVLKDVLAYGRLTSSPPLPPLHFLAHPPFLKTPQCASHRGVRLRGVHPTAESSSMVCLPLRSHAPRCASHRGVKLRGVHHTKESRSPNFSKNSAVCITPRSQAPRCASYRRVKMHTAESKSKSLRVSGCL